MVRALAIFVLMALCLLAGTLQPIRAQEMCTSICPDGSPTESYRCDSDYVPVCQRRQAPVYVDPRIAQARNLNELGRQAYDRKEFDKAADYFQQANATYPDDAYRKNIDLALSAGHFERGLDAFAKKNWSYAIAEFQRVLSFGANDDATANIKRAHNYQSWDYGIDAWKAKNYDLAITYFQTAESWWHDPKLADLIRRVKADKLEHAAVDAMKAGDFAQAETLFTEELSYAPGSKYALSRRADAIAEQARVLASQGGDIDAVIAAFDRAFRSYDAARAQLAGDKSALVNYAWAREVASGLLVKQARSKADWEKVVAAHQRWLTESGSDPDAARALSYVNSARAGHAIQNGKSLQDFQAAQAAAESALQADPNNKYAGRLEAFAVQQRARAEESTAIVNSMNVSANEAKSNTWQAYKQAMQAFIAQKGSPYASRCPWDTACKGTTVVGVPDKPQPNGFLPAKDETPEQRDLHAKIQKSLTQMKTLSDKLAKSNDTVERSLIKRELINTKSEADTNKAKYDEITRAHRIQKRSGTP